MQIKNFLGQSPAGFHKVVYAEWGEATPDQSTTICVHGLTRNGRDFDRLAETLRQHSHVFCPDIVGRGHSDWLANPAFYSYPQYLSDITALIARTGAIQIDWVGTSMGGLIGLLLAAQPNSPIRKLVLNDVGPFIAMAALQRIGTYVSIVPDFANADETERYMRQIYMPFGLLSDSDWQHLAAHGTRVLPNGRLALAHDPAIAQNFVGLAQDVDLWAAYDNITCPVLLLRGEYSDLLTADIATQMTHRGPRAKLVTFPKAGHAPALMDPVQIKTIANFLVD